MATLPHRQIILRPRIRRFGNTSLPALASTVITPLTVLLLLLAVRRPHPVEAIHMASAAAPAAALPRLAGQRVLVTGGGRGIGRAIALLCHREGARVAVSSRTRPELDETASLSAVATAAASSPQSCAAEPVDVHVADVTDRDQVESMVRSIAKKWGGLDVLVNNAGGSQGPKAPLETLDGDDLRRTLEVNVVGVHVVTSAVLRLAMLPRSEADGPGSIVNVSSRAGKVGLPNYSSYVASKFALEGMTASLAEELRDRNVLVNTLSPGMVDTRTFPKPAGRRGVRTAESVEEGFFALLESGLTGRYVHVDELDVARDRGLDDAVAMKPISEPLFDP